MSMVSRVDIRTKSQHLLEILKVLHAHGCTNFEVLYDASVKTSPMPECKKDVLVMFQSGNIPPDELKAALASVAGDDSEVTFYGSGLVQ